MPDFDVIIVGGRAAGSTLATRLGKQNLRVLLLERASIPSLPAASSPIIYSSTLKLLDEVGADESLYARNTPRIYEMFMDFDEYRARLEIPDENGRNYAYAIDRARFDGALWDNALRFPTVSGRDCFSVTDLLWDGDKVGGVIGKLHGSQEEEKITADIVIGADGRFSLIARKAGAELRDQHDEYPTTLYYAYWRGVKPYVNKAPTSVAYSGGHGIGFLVMDSADDTTVIVIEGQSRLLDFPGGKIEEFYIKTIMSNPGIAERLEKAEMVTSVRGMRDVGNFYRTPGGAGWALVGDAYLQEDPLDGQGIYNAVFGAKKLAQAIGKYTRGERTWRQALDWYDEKMRVETYYMYKMAVDRARTNLYSNPPDNELTRNMMRWFMQDEQSMSYFARLLTRQSPPNAMMLFAPQVIAGGLIRGGLRDLRDRLLNRLPFGQIQW